MSLRGPYSPTPEQVERLQRLAGLVERIAAGDRTAEDDFIRAVERPLRAILRTRARCDDAELDDLFQDTLLAVIRYIKAQRVRDPMAIQAILRLVAVRRVSRWERAERNNDRVDIELIPEVNAEEQRDSMQANHAVEVNERARLIKSALARMDPLDRDILHRFYVLEQNETTICAALKMTPKSFQLRKTRALGLFALQARAWMKGVDRDGMRSISWLRRRLERMDRA